MVTHRECMEGDDPNRRRPSRIRPCSLQHHRRDDLDELRAGVNRTGERTPGDGPPA